MTDVAQTWDIALHQTGNKSAGGILAITLPAVVSRQLIERGLWRAKVTLTDEGILVRPYPAEQGSRGQSVVELPAAWSKP